MKYLNMGRCASVLALAWVAIVGAQAADSAPAPASARSLTTAERVDERGRLNPWRLRHELLGLGEHPSTRQQAAFNAVWKPLLLAATHRGDAMAEVVLRLCETVDLLDRSGIASDCSPTPDARQLAWQRLDAVGWAPARYHRLRQSPQDAPEARAACAQAHPAKEDETCRLQADLDHYQRMNDVLATGHLGVVEHWTRCKVRLSDPTQDALAVACERTRHLAMAVAEEAPRFYALGNLDKPVQGTGSLSLRRPPLAGPPGGTDYRWPFDDGKMIRNNWQAMPGPVTVADFSPQVDALLAELDASIARDLRSDSRWAVFLIHRRAGRLFDSLRPPSVPWPTDEEAALADNAQPRGMAQRLLARRQER